MRSHPVLCATFRHMGSPPLTNMVIDNQLDQIARVQEAVLGQAEQAGFDQHSLFGIRLALEEALTNAIQHGNNADPSKHVTVRFAVDAEQLRVEIHDEGPGFTPEKLPDPTADEFINRPCGRGVMLMRAYMTEVRFNETGNCVTLIKNRHDAPGPKCC